ncbi:MAG: transposase [Candidatus Obscuribacter sp.]|nr:transposase [Candidatus Obscuribacter sp.]
MALAPELDDAALENLLFARVGRPKTERPLPDFSEVARSLKSHKGMSLALEWQRYISSNPHGYQYSYFCELFQEWSKHVDLVMRQEHLAGEKAFSDFAGSTLRITNRHSGEVKSAHLFVCCLGASSYALPSCTLTGPIRPGATCHHQILKWFLQMHNSS